MTYSYPKTDVEWWTNVKTHWKDLFAIFDMYLPTDEHEDRDGNVLVETLGVYITKLKEEQDPELARYFSAAWMAAPDNRSIHSIPGWHILCDLCSESHVLHDEPEGEAL